MVSLRERKARASYSNVADGLANLSSEEEEDQPGPSSRPSVANSNSANSGDEAEKDGDDDTSFSSGESSEFRPDSPSKDKKGKGKDGAGKSKSDSSSDDNEGVDEDEEEDEDVEMDDAEDEDIDPSLRGMSSTPFTEGTTPKPKLSRASGTSKPKRPPPPRPSVSSTATPIHGQSEISLLSIQHRKLIQASAELLTKPPISSKMTDNDRHAIRERDHSRAHGPTIFPSGHQVPYQTRLKTKRNQGWNMDNEVEWVDQSGPSSTRNENRRNESWSKHGYLTFSSPWEEWTGESWYPELFIGNEDELEEKDRGKRENWLLRDEVRLGLDDVGRWTKEELHFLNETEAEESYLPTPIYQNGESHITCHMGPHDQTSPQTFSIFESKPLSQTNPIVPHDGHTFFAGGPIWGMDWCPYPTSKSADFGTEQYLAVSTLPHLATRPQIAEKWPKSSKGSIQIWSLSPPSSRDVAMDGSAPQQSQMRCEMVLCVEGGPAMEIKWIPLGAWDDYDLSSIGQSDTRLPKIGILAAVQLDGSISFYAVPHPRFIPREPAYPVYIKMDKPLLQLEIPDAMAMCFDWITGSRIAVGLSNGHLAVWDVYDALKTGNSHDILPSLYTSVVTSAIRSISVGRQPPSEKQLGGDPPYVLMGSYDGSTTLLDIRDPSAAIELNRARIPCMAVKWIPQLASPVLGDIDYIIQIIKLRGLASGRSHVMSSHRGQIWNIATSDFHTMLASAGADGALILTEFYTGFYRKRKAPLTMHRLYEVDYSEVNDEYRLVDDFSPELQTIENATSRRPPTIAKRATHDPPTHLLKTAAWKPEVGIHKVTWNDGCGLGKAGWLASGGASGLGRVEWIEGRWKGGKAPK